MMLFLCARVVKHTWLPVILMKTLLRTPFSLGEMELQAR